MEFDVPEWMDQGLIGLLESLYFSEYQNRKLAFLDKDLSPPSCIFSIGFKNIWERAAKLCFQDPCNGSPQAELFIYIYCGLDYALCKYESTHTALAVREKWVRAIEDAIEILKKRPVNIHLNGVAPNDELDDVQIALSQLERLRDSMVVLSPPKQGQLKGDKAETGRFVLYLSFGLYKSTGKWRRGIVADVASMIFGKEVSESNVRRTIKRYIEQGGGETVSDLEDCIYKYY